MKQTLMMMWEKKLAIGILFWLGVTALGVLRMNATFSELTSFTEWIYAIMIGLHVADKAAQTGLKKPDGIFDAAEGEAKKP